MQPGQQVTCNQGSWLRVTNVTNVTNVTRGTGYIAAVGLNPVSFLHTGQVLKLMLLTVLTMYVNTEVCDAKYLIYTHPPPQENEFPCVK